jgi:predicted DNA-binding protein
MEREHSLRINLSTEELNRLKELAEEWGLNRSDMVRLLIKNGEKICISSQSK